MISLVDDTLYIVDNKITADANSNLSIKGARCQVLPSQMSSSVVTR